MVMENGFLLCGDLHAAKIHHKHRKVHIVHGLNNIISDESTHVLRPTLRIKT